ncbi:MAG: hypothetical protein C5B50_25365 [Verrucomicrobia bacterium]|nr:MAG: hypothetical protein C5B50_25365 [Verrucomicrobiota bacterium]
MTTPGSLRILGGARHLCRFTGQTCHPLLFDSTRPHVRIPPILVRSTLLFILLFCYLGSALGQKAPAHAPDLWKLAKRQAKVHRFSTLFAASDVRDYLSTTNGIRDALDWCKRSAVTKVYIETYRDGYQAERAALEKARNAFRKAGFEVSGCVTTTQVGKSSKGWPGISCYTDEATQLRLQSIFEYAAGLFDEIMIDDFLFTDCTCTNCAVARKAKIVIVGTHLYPVKGDTWEDYRAELMVRVSQDRILGAAKKVNPKARIIIKYPQWYDHFQELGYEVIRETAEFDRIWVGTEARNYEDRRWGGTPQYESYFLMRWLGGIGGAKCGGGWYDPYGTTEHTYIEQARDTVLGGAREAMLFCYGSLLRGTGPEDVGALRTNIPELLKVAKEIGHRQIVGLAAYKPPNSHAGREGKIFDFVGMLGLPLVPCHVFPTNALAAFFSYHATKDPQFSSELGAFIKTGKPVLITDGLFRALGGRAELQTTNVHILKVKSDPKSLRDLSQKELDDLRQPLLRPFKTTFHCTNQAALFLFKDRSWVVENFNDTAISAELNGKILNVPARGWVYQWR